MYNGGDTLMEGIAREMRYDKVGGERNSEINDWMRRQRKINAYRNV